MASVSIGVKRRERARIRGIQIESLKVKIHNDNYLKRRRVGEK